MFRIVGELNEIDYDIIRRFSTYVLESLMPSYSQDQFFVTINFVDPETLPTKEKEELEEFLAWMLYNGIDNGKHRTTLTISTTAFRDKKKPIKRLKTVLQCIAHELVHFKQYVTKELFDIDDEFVSWKGETFKVSWNDQFKDLEAYYFSPWEREAYGIEQGYYAIFKTIEKRRKNNSPLV